MLNDPKNIPVPNIPVPKSSIKSLTAKQAEILDHIEKIYQDYGQFPSLRQIGKKFGIQVRAVQQHIAALIKKGYLSAQSSVNRAYTLPQQDTPLPHPGNILNSGIPWIGTIGAGTPIPTYEITDQYIQIPTDFFSKGSTVFALNVNGDSMSGDHICHGDIAIIEVRPRYHSTDILALRVDEDEFTLKRIQKTQNSLSLLPSNPNFPIQTVQANRVTIVGTMIGLIRRNSPNHQNSFLNKPSSNKLNSKKNSHTFS